MLCYKSTEAQRKARGEKGAHGSGTSLCSSEPTLIGQFHYKLALSFVVIVCDFETGPHSVTLAGLNSLSAQCGLEITVTLLPKSPKC